MRPDELRSLWRDFGTHGYQLPVVEFYGHRSGPHRSFSNFFEHAPFTFDLPVCCAACEVEKAGRPVSVPITFSEQAIMLCKAALMADLKTYDLILRAKTPAEAKRLGRAVANWKQSTWDANVCEIARQVVTQKFTRVPGLSDILLATGSRLVAEMTRNDANWGTGLDIGHADSQRPSHWRGTNILGWALMEAREALRPPPLRSGMSSEMAAASVTTTSGAATTLTPEQKARMEASKQAALARRAAKEAASSTASPSASASAVGQVPPKEDGDDAAASDAEVEDISDVSKSVRKQRRVGRLQSDWLGPTSGDD